LNTLSSKKSFIALLIPLLTVGWFFKFPTTVLAQGQIQLTHEVTAEVSVLGNDFVKARKLAVSLALKSALEKALRNFLGDEKFEENQKSFAKTLKQSERYVQSYRFIEAVDDPLGKTAAVVMQVTLFPNALGKSLSNTGISAGEAKLKKVVLLISEKSLTSGEVATFWETVPISEAALAQNFIESGVELVARDQIQNIVSEENVLNAVNGNVNDAVQIGLQAGADVVILGNAVSSQQENQVVPEESTIQATISVRAISALTSTVIAAKSDFATAHHKDLLAGELQAFGDASKKLSEFLLSSLNRYWQAPSTSQGIQDNQPQPASPLALPLSMEDL
jgi:post-segregation antitoxin (ccd killing protein)